MLVESDFIDGLSGERVEVPQSSVGLQRDKSEFVQAASSQAQPARFDTSCHKKEHAHKAFDVDIPFFLFADGHHLKTLLVFVYHSGPPKSSFVSPLSNKATP